MRDTRRQHIVPRTYLQLFARQRKDDYYVFTYDKYTGKLYEENIINASVEKDFYTLKMIEDRLAWENFYANQIEPRYKDSVHLLAQQASSLVLMDKAQILTEAIKIKLAIVMIYQLFRCKRTVQITENYAASLLPEVLEKAKEKYGNTGNRDRDVFINNFYPSKDFLKPIYADVLTDPDRMIRYANLLAKRCWILYRIIGEKEFVTSDNPVSVGSLNTQELQPSQLAFLGKSNVVYYPISPKLLIAVYDNSIFFDAIKPFSSCLLELSSDKDNQFIDSVNHLFVVQSDRQVFAKSKCTLQQDIV